MDKETNFKDVVKPIINRYNQTSFAKRWEEAITSDPDPKPLEFWIRESDDLVNIVWLNRSGVWDITLFPQTELSTFNFARLSAITGFEVQEGVDVAKQRGLTVAGHYAVDAFVSSGRGGFIWVAMTTKEEAELRAFVGKLSKLLLEV